jgi:hypothetical protein
MRWQTRHIACMGVSNATVSNVRSRRSARTERPKSVGQPPARVIGKRIEARFRDAAKTAVRDALAAAVPVAVMTDDEQVAWLHPDGIVRASPDPVKGST